MSPARCSARPSPRSGFRSPVRSSTRCAPISGVGVSPIKQAYKRSRAFQANAAVKAPANIAAASQSPTYPSGHATFGAEVAFLLAMMVPEKKRELFERGWAYGEQRVASGVAYPSDWEGGHIGGAVMVTLMLQKPEFRADFDAVKGEIRQGARAHAVKS